VPDQGVDLAVYGAFNDVTRKLNNEYKGKKITVNNDTFDGDPAYGIIKKLQLTIIPVNKKSLSREEKIRSMELEAFNQSLSTENTAGSIAGGAGRMAS